MILASFEDFHVWSFARFSPSRMKMSIVSLGPRVWFAFLVMWVRLSATAKWCSFIVTPSSERMQHRASPVILSCCCLSFRVQLTIQPVVTVPTSTGQVQRELLGTSKKASGLTFLCFPTLLSITSLGNCYVQSASRPRAAYPARAVVGMTTDGKGNEKWDPVSWGLCYLLGLLRCAAHVVGTTRPVSHHSPWEGFWWNFPLFQYVSEHLQVRTQDCYFP